MTGAGAPRDDGTMPYLPTVVASIDPDTSQRVYLYGWASTVVHEMNRDVQQVGPYLTDRFIGPAEWTTTVEWAGAPRRTHVYPSASDWARGRELAQAERPGIELVDPTQMEGTTTHA